MYFGRICHNVIFLYENKSPFDNFFRVLVELSVCLSCGSTLREGKDAYITVEFGQRVNFNIIKFKKINSPNMYVVLVEMNSLKINSLCSHVQPTVVKNMVVI